jgi:polyhydroxyalkanoate synthesis regulator phasin
MTHESRNGNINRITTAKMQSLIDEYYGLITQTSKIAEQTGNKLKEIATQSLIEGYTNAEARDLVDEILNYSEFTTNTVKRVRDTNESVSIHTRNPLVELSEQEKDERIIELENKVSYLSGRIAELESKIKFYEDHR